MSKSKKAKTEKPDIAQPISSAPPQATTQTEALPESRNSAMALCGLTIVLTVVLLVVLNRLILAIYHPDIAAIKAEAYKITIKAHDEFFPEPVERLQYQLSLLFTPFFILGSWLFFSRKKNWFQNNPGTSAKLTFLGILSLLGYGMFILSRNLTQVPFKKNINIFDNNILLVVTPVVAIVIYAVSAYFFVWYSSKESHRTDGQKKIIAIACFAIAGFTLTNLFMYDIFQLSMQDIGKRMETNAVFYAVSQVCAGKSLLVDLNNQYGLYPWILKPIFSLIGLSIFKFSLVMGTLNAAAFLFFYLGIRKLLNNEILALIVFLCVSWWFFWLVRIPLDAIPRVFYQFHPIRIFFPSLQFYVLTSYLHPTNRYKKIQLPLMAFCAGLGIFWNMDSGVVTFGAVLIALIASEYRPENPVGIIKHGIKYAAYIFGGALVALLLLMVSTKMQSGAWPRLDEITKFQTIFYISGYFMMPMGALQFWNFVALTYIAGGVYALYRLQQGQAWDTAIVVFLFVLGTGIFSYYQGRSYDFNVTWVMYPAIIILGVFCNKLIKGLSLDIRRLQITTSHLFFLVIFFFLTDGALTMAYHSPAIYKHSLENVTSPDPAREAALKDRMDFMKSVIKPGDSVIILAQDYESYFYSECRCVNPAPIPGSTEWFLKKDIATLINCIKTQKYPVVIDHRAELWLQHDTIFSAVAQYYSIDKSMTDGSLVYFKPRKAPPLERLKHDDNAIFYSNAEYITSPVKVIELPDTFNIEFYAALDTTRLKSTNLLFTNLEKAGTVAGMVMGQVGDTLNNYVFLMGNGSSWSEPVGCRMSCTEENHVLIKVQGGLITCYWNGIVTSASSNTGHIAQSRQRFYINTQFAGRVKEMLISR